MEHYSQYLPVKQLGRHSHRSAQYIGQRDEVSLNLAEETSQTVHQGQHRPSQDSSKPDTEELLANRLLVSLQSTLKTLQGLTLHKGKCNFHPCKAAADQIAEHRQPGCWKGYTQLLWENPTKATSPPRSCQLFYLSESGDTAVGSIESLGWTPDGLVEAIHQDCSEKKKTTCKYNLQPLKMGSRLSVTACTWFC